MSFSSFILPFLSLIAGIASLFFDPNNTNRKTIMRLLVIALLLTCGFSIYSNFNEYKNAEANEIQRFNEIEWNKKHIDQLTSILKNFRLETNDRLQAVFELLNFGWSKTKIREALSKTQVSKNLSESIDADKERTKLASLESNAIRKNITIQYFPKNVDKEIVENALKELGFRLISGRPNLPNIPTNAIWFGNKVETDNVKLVAYTLIRAGIEIKVITPFSSPGGNKSNLIQVGSSTKFINSPAITIPEIQKTETFKSAY